MTAAILGLLMAMNNSGNLIVNSARNISVAKEEEHKNSEINGSTFWC